MKSQSQEKDFSIRDFKSDLQRDLLMRRYQKWSRGESLMEDRIMDLFHKYKVQFVSSWRGVFKRSCDAVLSIGGLMVMFPLLLLIAAIIKLDSRGPILFQQTRVGKKGRLFNIYKFRTMIQDAEKTTGPVWAAMNDLRITRFGKFLRKSHLDELPQLFNVLCGEMSIVGPRPERPYFVQELRKVIPHYDRRFYAKPGITGLAQIKRRYDETLADVRKKLKYDILYAQKMCPLLDLQVMALTIGSVVFQTGR